MDTPELGPVASRRGPPPPRPTRSDVGSTTTPATHGSTAHGGAALQLAFFGMATLGLVRSRLGGLTVSDLLFMACGLVVVVKLLAGDSRGLARPEARRASPLIMSGTLVLLTFGILSCFRSWYPLGSLQVVLRFAWLTLVWFWVLRLVAHDRAALYKLLYGWRIAILTSSFFAIAGQLGIYEAGQLQGENRQMAFFFHPNELAYMLVVGLPLIIFDVPRRPGQEASTRRRVIMTGFVVWAIMTTGSMTAFLTGIVAFVAGALAVPASRGRYRWRPHTGLMSIALATLAALGLFFAINSDLPVFQRFTRYSEGDSGIESSVGTRTKLNDEVISHLDNTLFVGTGLQLQGYSATGSIGRISQSDVPPGVVVGVHNMYLKLVHEAGVPALIGLLIVVAAAVRQAWRTAINARQTALYPVAVAILTAIIAANAMAQFAPIAYQRYYWLPIAMATCLWSVRREELREEHRGPTSMAGGTNAITKGREPLWQSTS